MDDILAANPHLLPAIREYVENKEIEQVKSSTSPSKRRRRATEDSTYLGDLFDFLAPSPSSRLVLRPRKMAKYSSDAVICESRATEMSSGNELDLENTQLSVTEALEKRMEVCFGVIPDKSDLLLPRPQKRKRSGTSNGDGEMTKTKVPLSKSIKQSFNAFQPQNGQETSTFEWSLDDSKVDLAEICPFSLSCVSGMECPRGSACKLKGVCTVRNPRSHAESADVLNVRRANRAAPLPALRCTYGSYVCLWL